MLWPRPPEAFPLVGPERRSQFFGEVCVFWSILHRTIFLELAKVFLMSLVGITGILLMAGIVAEASQHGLGPTQILAIIPLIIPSTLPYTIPATTLFAACVVYGRLAADNEILAIKAAGVNVLKVVWPGVLLGLLMSGVTASLYYDVIPNTHHMMRTMFIDDVEDFLYGMLKRDGCIKHPKLNYVINARRVQGRKLQDALFMRRDPKGTGYDIVAHAREAELHADVAKKELKVHMRRCNIISSEKDGTSGYVADKEWTVPLPTDFNNAGSKFRASDMTWQELLEHRRGLVKQKEKLEAEIALHRVLLLQKQGPDALGEDIMHRTAKRKQAEQEIRNVDAEFQMRPALALGCLFFVLVGCPVGIWFSRSDYLSAFITCFLPIVFVYYPLILCGINMGKSGTLPLVPAIWGANGLIGVIALGLFRGLLKN
jgi:lipopolysaccharide export system permease protein